MNLFRLSCCRQELFFRQEAGRTLYLTGNSGLDALMGFGLFVVSDFILAFNRFVKKFKWVEFFVIII